MRLIAFLCTLAFLTYPAASQSRNEYALIPKPFRLEPRNGQFVFSSSTALVVPTGRPDLTDILNDFLNQFSRTSGLKMARLDSVQAANRPKENRMVLRLVTETGLGEEGYRLDVQEKQILLEASSVTGFFYAIQTLYQLLPPEIYAQSAAASPVVWAVPACRIEDKPRFSYRGLHLDVSRHFMPVAFVKKYIDLMARHKLNRFHWHLTDDQGWRIEIKKYPKLTQIGSLRKETLIGHYEEYDPRQFDGQPHGGFYTQDEIRDVVRYAQARQVTIIPEIDIPGHSLAILAAYPEYGCGPGPYEVATKWGVFEDILCPYEKTFAFLEDVLTEVIGLFPGTYVHIGGDEAPKTAWRKSAYVQSLIKRLGLKNENQLQGHFVRLLDRWLTSKERKLIGWDEILEGGPLSPDATIMSWRGTRGGLQAARLGHDAIMTPAPFVYLDFYQSDAAQEPTAFGNFTPLEKVYSYDPAPDDLPENVREHIIGPQANVWTEYIKTPQQVEYQAWPRAAALAEVAWTPAASKDWADFSRRMPVHFRRLDLLNVNYSRAFYDVLAQSEARPDNSIQVSLTAKAPRTDIHYTLDGSEPTARSPRYQTPLRLTRSATLRAVAVQDGEAKGEVQQWPFMVSKATGKPVRMSTTPTVPPGSSTRVLTDGRPSTLKAYSAEMRGVAGLKADFVATVDLEQPQTIQRVTVGFVRSTGHGVFLPRQITVAVSDDGKTFRTMRTMTPDPLQRGRRESVRQALDFGPVQARYVRITGQNIGTIPAGFGRAGWARGGPKAAIMVDEIEIE